MKNPPEKPGRFTVLEAATLEELEWVIGKQMDYYNTERRHFSLGYRSPVEYLVSEGFMPKTLAEIGLASGSVSGAQVLRPLRTIFRHQCSEFI